MKTANFPIDKFNQIVSLNPYWSFWTCFCEIIEGEKNLSTKTIRKYFNLLVDKNDYVQDEKFALLKYLYLLASNLIECR